MMNGRSCGVASPGGMITDENGNQRTQIPEMKRIRRVEGEHAEVMINPTVAKRLGLKPGDDLSRVLRNC